MPPFPTKPITPGVRRTDRRISLASSARRKTYPGNRGVRITFSRSLQRWTAETRGRKVTTPFSPSRSTTFFSCRGRICRAYQCGSSCVISVGAVPEVMFLTGAAPPFESHPVDSLECVSKLVWPIQSAAGTSFRYSLRYTTSGIGKVLWFNTAPSKRTLAAARLCWACRAVSRRVACASTTKITPSVILPSTTASA